MEVENTQKEKDNQQPSKERACPICLHNWNDPTALDNCPHVFCFDCITEWTRLKPECPLCKRALQNLKHQLWIRADDEEKPSWESEGRVENIMTLRSEYEMEQIRARTSYPADVEKHAAVQVVKSLYGEIHALRNQSISAMSSQSIYREAISRIEKEKDEYKRLLHMFNAGAPRSELFSNPAFRRVIYLKNLMPRSICPPMFNVIFNTDYIKNQRGVVRAQIIPFVVREVLALTPKKAIDIDTYADRILDYLSSNINRQEIVNFLTARGIQNPHHFLNNILHFASTGEMLNVYDQNSEYTPRRTPYVGLMFPEDDDVLVLNSNSDVEVVGERRTSRENRHPPSTPPAVVSTSSSAADDNPNHPPQQHSQPQPQWRVHRLLDPMVPTSSFLPDSWRQMLSLSNFNLSNVNPSLLRQLYQPHIGATSAAGVPTSRGESLTLPQQLHHEIPTTFANELQTKQQQQLQNGSRRRHLAADAPLSAGTGSPESGSATMVTLDDDNSDPDDSVEFVTEVKKPRKQQKEDQDDEERRLVSHGHNKIEQQGDAKCNNEDSANDNSDFELELMDEDSSETSPP